MIDDVIHKLQQEGGQECAVESLESNHSLTPHAVGLGSPDGFQSCGLILGEEEQHTADRHHIIRAVVDRQ